MHSADRIAWHLLWWTGVVLAFTTLLVAAWRSTIPVALDHEVARVEVLREHTPGLDDVHLLTFTDGSSLQVDREVYRFVGVGDHLVKKRWHDEVTIQTAAMTMTVSLTWSQDLRRLALAVPLLLMLLAALRLWAEFRRQPASSSSD